MPTSGDRFFRESIRRSMRDRAEYLQRMRAETREETVPEAPRFDVDDYYYRLGSLSSPDPWILTAPAGMNYTYSRANTTVNNNVTVNVPVPEDPTDWWGRCGERRCVCLGMSPCYRDSSCRQVIPGTDERRGYRLTIRGPGRRRTTIQRYWQANSERRARAYQGHFFPNEKIVSVRRAGVRRNGTRVENYVPEQCYVMLAGVTCPIDDTKVY